VADKATALEIYEDLGTGSIASYHYLPLKIWLAWMLVDATMAE
jgi:hypothetical protein